MSESLPDQTGAAGGAEQDGDVEELAEHGGVGLAAGEPSTFEPEEDPEAVDDVEPGS